VNDEKYASLISGLPQPIVKKFIVPLANKDPLMHKNIMSFLFLLDEKGYCIKQKTNSCQNT